MDKRGNTKRRRVEARRQMGRSSDLSAAVRRADALKERINASPQQDLLMLEAAEELSTTLEELQVADEELRHQNDELWSVQDQLETQRFKYEELFESAPDGYLITNAEGLINKANRAAAEKLCVEKSFIAGKALASYIAPGDRKAFRTVLNKLANGSSCDTEELELEVITRHKWSFTAAFRISPTRNQAGRITELRWTLRDVTDVKKRAERIIELNTELETRVRERTAELEQVSAFKDELLAREQRARAEAETANRSKDEFLAVVSHELRTPLNAILGWAQLIRQDVESEQRIHAAEVIERSARAQARLINDILDVSRVVSGGLPLDKRPLDLSRVIETATEEVRPAIESKGIKLIVNIDHLIGIIPTLRKGGLVSDVPTGQCS